MNTTLNNTSNATISTQHAPSQPIQLQLPLFATPIDPVFGTPENRQFNIKKYIRTFGPDYLSLLALGILGIILYLLRPVPHRFFPLQFQNGEIVYPEFAYPLVNNIIPTWLAALLAFGVSILIIALVQIRQRDPADFNAALLGLLYSLITAAVFQVFVKYLIGGLRPHFYDVCKPRLAPGGGGGTGFGSVMFDRSICTGDDNAINDALESFPSGHSTCAFAGFVFLSLYLNAHLKVFGPRRAAHWKFVVFWMPLLWAFLISCSLSVDGFHHWYDIFVGGVIGTLVAFGAYRSQFCSVWDWRDNHLVSVDYVQSDVGGGDKIASVPYASNI